MKYKTRIELTLPGKVELFAEVSRLRKVEGVLHAAVRDFRTIIIQYDRRLITERNLLKSTVGTAA